MENPIKTDDLGVPLFLETSMLVYHRVVERDFFKFPWPSRESEIANMATCARFKVDC